MQVALWIDTPALGDTIAAIPTLRKLSKVHDQPLTVFTSLPDIFAGHPCVKEALPSDADKSDYKVYRSFYPLVGQTIEVRGEKIEFRHSNTDIRQFHATSLGFSLVSEEMETDLYAEEALELPYKDYVIIHPTHTWATRTWDQHKWQALVDQLNDRGIPVIAVGRDSKEVGFFSVQKPVMEINIKLGMNLLNDPRTTVAALRWMMNHRAKAVVTMDSGILHIAGTTDVQIIQLGSSIDPKLRAPYRKGSQDYKYAYVSGSCDLFCSSNMKYNVREHGSIHGVPPQIKCLENKPTMECHPTVSQVFSEVIKQYDVRAKIRLVHLLLTDDISPERQHKSIASISQLADRGVEYIQIWNERWKDTPPRETYAYPDQFDKVPIGPGHYGNYRAYVDSGQQYFTEDVDAIIFAEGDALLTKHIDEVVKDINRAYDACELHNISYFSFGSRHSLFNQNELISSTRYMVGDDIHVVNKVIGTQMVMLHKRVQYYCTDRFAHEKWTSSDIYLNNLFMGKFNIGIFDRPLALQSDGVSAIDGYGKKHDGLDILPGSILPNKAIEDCNFFTDALQEYDLSVSNVLEIGSRDGHHAEALRRAYNVDSSNVYIVEPNPMQWNRITSEYPTSTLFKVAISNREGSVPFYQIDVNDDGWNGISGLLDRPDLYREFNHNVIQVEAITGQTLLNSISSETIDLCKIDVEGLTYEVLEGFGDSLSKIQALHVETEEVEIWKDQKTDDQVNQYLTDKGFIKIKERFVNTRWGKQFDQVWIQKSIIDRSKKPKAFITHCNESYVPIVQKMVETVRQFSDTPIITYVLNSDARIEGEGVITHRLDVEIREGEVWETTSGNPYVNRKSPTVFDVITKKVDATIHALTYYADSVAYLDGDSIATPRIDELFDYDRPDLKHPMFTHGLQSYMMMDGRGNPFITGPNGEEQWKTDVSLTLEQPLCDMMAVDNSFRLESGGYVQTGYFVANTNHLPFLEEWREWCQMPEIKADPSHYAMYHEETIVNVLLWKYKYSERMPLCYINANDTETIFDVYRIFEYNGSDRQHRRGWLGTPGKLEDIKVLHGEKRPEVVDQMVEALKKYAKTKVLFLAPHLSTGGMPEFLLGRLKALNGDPSLEIHVVEFTKYADTYTVQRDQIQQMLGSRFHEIGHLGALTNEERETRLLAIIGSIQPDVIHIEESPEAFDSFNQMSEECQSWLYQPSQPWKIVETCHNIWFNPRQNKRISPDAYLFVTPHHTLETFSDEPSEKFEAFYPIIPQTKSESQRRKSLEILGLEHLSDAKHLINIGLWTKGKNQGEALDWARQLQALHPDQYQFHFIGNQAPNFQDYWGPLMLDLPPNVHIHGERSDIDTFYQLADAVVFNSVWECNPLALRQALGYPIPVMARNLPQYHSMYTDQLTVIQGDTTDPLRLVESLKNPISRKPNPEAMAKFKQEHLQAYMKTLKGPVIRTAQVRDRYTIRWQNGPTVQSKAGRPLDVEFWSDGQLVYSNTLNGEGHWCRPSDEWYRQWTVKVDGKEHTLELEGQRAVVQFDSSSLGDTLSWVEGCVDFKRHHNLEVLYLATHKNWLFDHDYYRSQGVEFIAPGEWPQDAIAKWNIGVHMQDPPGQAWFPNKNKRDWRKIYLGDIATDHLGMPSCKRPPKLAYKGKSRRKKPYICIATQSTAQAKYWNNPTGWQELIDHYRAKGYDVYHLSKEGTNLQGVIQAPEALDDVYKLLKGAQFFMGISSGLSWFAWACDVPVVLISGFTPEECEFQNEKTLRIIDKSVCNSCWAWDHFNRGDWNWCPKFKGTEDHFQCTKVLTGQRVINLIENWQQDATN